jgi:hypothetical protein
LDVISMGSENNLILIWRPICAAMAMGDGSRGEIREC